MFLFDNVIDLKQILIFLPQDARRIPAAASSPLSTVRTFHIFINTVSMYLQ